MKDNKPNPTSPFKESSKTLSNEEKAQAAKKLRKRVLSGDYKTVALPREDSASRNRELIESLYESVESLRTTNPLVASRIKASVDNLAVSLRVLEANQKVEYIETGRH